jgi:predicted anti-sigma-YlaC factor YlaD
MRFPSSRFWPALAALGLFMGGCSTIKHNAINQLDDALANGGTTFASDNDPQLIKDAAPFSLKLMEGLLAENPGHRGLQLAAASGFTEYSYAFVQQDADEVEARDLATAQALRARARGLYLRARDHGLRGLEVTHPKFSAELRRQPVAAVRACTVDDVPLLYWTAASWAAAISLSKDNPTLIADLPEVQALIDRALELNEQFDHGAIHSFLITYEMSRAGGSGDPVVRARRHFERAVELSDGQQAAPFVAYAESVCVQTQDRAQFLTLLDRALAIDVDARPEWRLVNLVLQKRARWLRDRVDELFLPDEKTP